MDSQDAPSGDATGDGSPSLVRASKRRRFDGNDTAVNNNNDDITVEKITLPPEMWANVMKYLPFDNILSCCVVSRSMLHETMPLLTKIQINKAAQMNLAVASRFRDVTDIHINSLLLREIDDEFEDVNFDFESRIRVLPFLFCFVKTLERVHFGAKDNLGNVIEGFSPTNACFWEESDEGYPYEAPWDLMMAFIDSLSGAFICGALPQHLQISGLCCPSIRDRRSTQCATCIRACKSFPLESVARFHSGGSSAENARSGRAFGLDVCLPIAQVESIIETRPGGKELLLSDERLFRLLESGRRWEVGDDDSGKLIIVKYNKTQVDEMKRVITYAGLDVKKLPVEKLQEAVLKSFEKGTILPPKMRRYLSEQSLLCLKDEVDLCVDVSEICGSTSEFLPSLKCVVNVLVQYYDEEALPNTTERWFEYEDIVGDCFTLIRRFLELDKDALTKDDMNNVVPCLAEALALNDTNRLEAASALGLIYANGPEEQRQMIINAGVISKFVGLLELSEESITKIALSGLFDILADEKKEHVEAMVQAGGITKLVSMLHSSDDLMVDKAQSLLVIAANHNIQQVIDAKAHEGLFRIILSDEHKESIPKCSVLLHKIFEVDNPPIQQAVNANLTPRIVEILNTTEDAVVQKNLAFFCIALASGANEDNIDALMRESGLLTSLVDLQYSSIGDVSEAAITCLEHIVNIRSSFDAESGDALAWGEYAFLDLVDSDDDGSSVSCEEALEVSDEEVALEEQQAAAGVVTSSIYNPPRCPTTDEDCDVFSRKETNDSTHSLLGIPRKLLQTILIYATQNQTEVNILASVCKEFSVAVETYGDIAPREGFTFRHPCFGYSKLSRGLRYIRKFQKGSNNEIMEILCDWKDEVDGTSVMSSKKLHNLAADVMKRMNHGGPCASFRLREDTVYYLFELLHGYMIKRLEHALLNAIHGDRTQVERQDFLLLPSQEMQSKCNIEENYHGNVPSYVCSCSLPSSSGILWRWPEDDCLDLLQPGDGRRIIRRLAYKAGILQMTSGLFEVAEAELLHTLGILLVEAFESSVDIAKHAQFLEPDGELAYGIRNLPGSVDMFQTPPPPFCESSEDHSNADTEDIEHENERILYTIVPGQISDAAKKRGFKPHHVYGIFFDDAEETEAEKAYYYKDGLKDCESKTDSLEENFIPSKTFVGAKNGFVFTKGEKGLGYYKDEVVGPVVSGCACGNRGCIAHWTMHLD